MEPIVNTLPEDFDGVFRFTNWTTEDFVFQWDKKSYTFPAMKTSPMLIVNATPLEIQQIRKKAARKLAEREFFKSDAAKKMESIERDSASGAPRLNSIHMANTYSDKELQDGIQKCLTPLPVARAMVSDAPKSRIEDKLNKDDEGNIVTEAIDKKTSLRKKALEA